MSNHICRDCERPFNVTRTNLNRNADIRRCESCKRKSACIEQHERTGETTHTRVGGRRPYLARD